MAPTIKVTYFTFKGLAESIRLLLAYGDIEFEDVRLDIDTEWPKVKPTTPFGQLPLYEENGKVMWQCLAIARYLAKKVKLVGNNPWEDLEIDAIGDTVNDLRIKVIALFLEPEGPNKEVIRSTLVNETVPFFLARLEAIAKTNKGYLAAGRLTWADFYFTGILDVFNFLLGVDVIENYPNLKAVKKNVCEVPRIKAYIQRRPKTDY